mgnify:CR=1 FL=1
MRDKQQQIANVLDDKQKNVQALHDQVESKEYDAQELMRQKIEVGNNFLIHLILYSLDEKCK